MPDMTTASVRAVVVSVRKEQFREGLFKYIDSAPKKHIIQKTPSKRVITLSLFERIQHRIDDYERARISLVDIAPDKSMRVVVADTKPMSHEYNEILRRIRF